jgi:hypothetical protein
MPQSKYVVQPGKTASLKILGLFDIYFEVRMSKIKAEVIIGSIKVIWP